MAELEYIQPPVVREYEECTNQFNVDWLNQKPEYVTIRH